MRALVLIAFSVSLVLPACRDADQPGQPSGSPSTELVFLTGEDGSVRLFVEVADSPEERIRGLMERTTLAPNHGMVFLFDGPTDGGFWMKDTLIPLSIAFWDSRMRIVAILDMDPCREDLCPVYEPRASYVGAVEVNQGYFDRHGVETGDLVRLGVSADR